jgi:glycosyltransferase 2 family protein
MLRKLRLDRIAALAAGLVVVVGLVAHAGWSAVASALGQLSLNILLLVAFVHLPVVFLLGLAWWIIGRRTPWASAGPFITARLVRDSVGDALPLTQVGGFAAGLRMLHLRGTKFEDGAPALFADLLAEFLAKIAYLVIGIGGLYAIRPASHIPFAIWLLLGLTIGVAIVAVIFRTQVKRASHAALLLFQKHWPGFASNQPLSIAWNKNVGISAALHLVCWLAGGAETCIIFLLLGQPISMAEALIVDSLVSGLRTFGFLVPAEAGVQEAGYVLAATLLGIPPATSLAVSMVRRARDLVIAVPGIALWLRAEQRALSRNLIVEELPAADH